MQLEHMFTVPVGAEDAFAVLTDIERVAPCMPGATLGDVDGDEFSGTVRVKVGPMEVTYEGTASFTEKDPDAGAATIEASGQQQRGAGTADATIRAVLTEDGPEETTVTVTTDLAITGRPAQFGRGVMEDVGEKLLGEFADCLADELSGRSEEQVEPEEAGAAGVGEPAGAAAAAPGAVTDRPARPRPSDDAIDLLDVAGPSVARRLAPVLAGLAVLVLIIWWLRRGDDEA